MPKLTKQTRKVLELLRKRSLEESQGANSAELFAEHYKAVKDFEKEKKWREWEKYHNVRGLALRILEIDLREQHGLEL